MTDQFPPEGRLIHIAYEAQWDTIAAVLDGLGVRLFEIPPGPSVPDSADVPTYGLMFVPGNDD